jgi:signal transduction histidine kinase
MSLRTLKWFAILLPPLIIGGFEYIRHHALLHALSMEMGNLYITLLTLLLSFLSASWMFREIARTNARLAEEQSRRAVYEERERLAQELHDNIAQMLFYLNVKLKQGKIEDARSAAKDIDNHLRQAIYNLRTPPSEATAFLTRVGSWLTDWSAMTGIEVDIRIDLGDIRLAPAQEVLLFGIVQEAFTNIRKHSLAGKARLEMSMEGRRWQLTIADDGVGLPDESAASIGYGLTLLRKRAQELSAVLDVKSGPGSGTELIINGEAVSVT